VVALVAGLVVVEVLEALALVQVLVQVLVPVAGQREQ